MRTRSARSRFGSRNIGGARKCYSCARRRWNRSVSDRDDRCFGLTPGYRLLRLRIREDGAPPVGVAVLGALAQALSVGGVVGLPAAGGAVLSQVRTGPIDGV